MPITLRLPFSWTSTRFSRYCKVLALELSAWSQQTHLLQLGLCLRHDDGCVLCDGTVGIGKREKVGVELVSKLEMTAVPSRAGVFEILGVESTLELVKTEASNLNFTSLAVLNPHETTTHDEAGRLRTRCAQDWRLRRRLRRQRKQLAERSTEAW
jgi:hypothetical protein